MALGLGCRASVFRVWSFTATGNLGLLGLEELRPARDSHYPGEGPGFKGSGVTV